MVQVFLSNNDLFVFHHLAPRKRSRQEWPINGEIRFLT